MENSEEINSYFVCKYIAYNLFTFEKLIISEI